MDFSIFDLINDCIGITKFDSNEIVYCNQTMQNKFKLKNPVSKHCYEQYRNQNEQCTFCPKKALLENGSNISLLRNKHLGIDYYVHSYLIEHNNEKYQLEWLVDLQDYQDKSIKLDFNSQNYIIDLVHQLLNAQNFDDAVNTLLSSVVHYYKGDRGYIFEFDFKNKTARNTYEVCANESISKEIDNLQNIPIEVLSVWINNFETKNYFVIDNIENIKDSRKEEYDILNAQGIKALLAVPFYENNKLKGFLGVDDPKLNSKDNYFLENMTYFIATEIKNNRLKEQLSSLSYQDGLTHLQNRNSFNKYSVNFNHNKTKNIGLAFVDINGLKEMNDTYGHDYGDIMIIHVANIINNNFSLENDHTFRISGDEFVIISENITFHKFQQRISKLEKDLSQNKSKVASCGYVWENQVDKLEKLLKNADNLMYIHKKEYYDTNGVEFDHHNDLLNTLINSIMNKEYLIYIQPKFNIKNKNVDCGEVLVRYRDESGKIVSPNQFLPLLEQKKIINHIDYFVLEETCKTLHQWHKDNNYNIKLALNFSKITLFEKDFVNKLTDMCDLYQIPYSDLEIEVTETQNTFDKTQMKYLLQHLFSLGFSTSLDDFGVGYSSYSFLNQSHFNVLKIDRELVSNINNNSTLTEIVSSIIQLCNKLNIKCVCEGVETKQEFDILKELGCHYVQGYYIDRPLDLTTFENKYIK